MPNYTISNLIADLQKLADGYGDLPVAISIARGFQALTAFPQELEAVLEDDGTIHIEL